MIELIKKSLMAGVGAAVVTKDKIEQALGEFVREGKVTAEDARKMAEKVAEEGRKEFHEACEQLGTKLRSVTAQADEKTQGQVTALTKRLQELELKIANSGPVRRAQAAATAAMRKPAPRPKAPAPKRAKPAQTAKARRSK
jgi:polyhydroxyalkanoate synthesis regulator phasin